MPRGSVHTESGIIVAKGPTLYLQRDEGGHRPLDTAMLAWKWLGRRVTIEGVRDGFDLLAVRRIELC